MNQELMELLYDDIMLSRIYNRFTENLGPLLLSRNSKVMTLGHDKMGNEIVIISPNVKMKTLRQLRSL